MSVARPLMRTERQEGPDRRGLVSLGKDADSLPSAMVTPCNASCRRLTHGLCFFKDHILVEEPRQLSYRLDVGYERKEEIIHRLGKPGVPNLPARNWSMAC